MTVLIFGREHPVMSRGSAQDKGFVMCLSVRMEQFGSHQTDFHEI